MTGRLSAIAGTVRDLGIPLPGRRLDYDVAGKVVLITGGGDGIGAALARTLHRRGATVALVDVNESSLATAERSFESQRVVTVTADVRDRDGMTAAVQTIIEQLGRIDVVVANAGITPPPRQHCARSIPTPSIVCSTSISPASSTPCIRPSTR